MATQTPTTKPAKTNARLAWQYACTDSDGRFSDCGYLVRNHDKAELVRFSRAHAKEGHGMDVPAAHFEAAAKQVAF